jgi:hypothetical protein
MHVLGDFLDVTHIAARRGHLARRTCGPRPKALAHWRGMFFAPICVQISQAWVASAGGCKIL